MKPRTVRRNKKPNRRPLSSALPRPPHPSSPTTKMKKVSSSLAPTLNHLQSQDASHDTESSNRLRRAVVGGESSLPPFLGREPTRSFSHQCQNSSTQSSEMHWESLLTCSFLLSTSSAQAARSCQRFPVGTPAHPWSRRCLRSVTMRCPELPSNHRTGSRVDVPVSEQLLFPCAFLGRTALRKATADLTKKDCARRGGTWRRCGCAKSASRYERAKSTSRTHHQRAENS